MMKKTVAYVVLAIILLSCGSNEQITQVTKFDYIQHQRDNGVIYALPKTRVKVEVVAKEVIEVPGPFYQFAEKYLGIDEVIAEEKKYWEISDVTINQQEEVDEEHYYIIEPAPGFAIDFLTLTKEGFILPAHKINLNPDIQVETDYVSPLEPAFTDLSVKRYYGEKTDTLYRRVFQDSVFVRVPFLKTQVAAKTLEEKAEEAANFLFKLRKRRFKLLAGMYDFLPSGPSLEVSVRELDALEKEYLALFTGKVYERIVTKTFEFIPDTKHLEKPLIVFRFLPEFGVLDADDLRGRPIVLEVISEGKTNPLNNYLNQQTFDDKKAKKSVDTPTVYYRIPEMVEMRLMNGKDKLAVKRSYVYQYGKIVTIPATVLPTTEYQIVLPVQE